MFSLLLKLEKNPSTIIRIIKHNKVIGELSAPKLTKQGEAASKALLQIVQKFNKIKMPKDLSVNYKHYLYGLKK